MQKKNKLQYKLDTYSFNEIQPFDFTFIIVIIYKKYKNR